MSENINLNVMSMYQIIHAGYRKGRGQNPFSKDRQSKCEKEKGKKKGRKKDRQG